MDAKRWIALAVFLILLFSMATSTETVRGVMETSKRWTVEVYDFGTGADIALINLSGIITHDRGEGSIFQDEGYSQTIFLEQIETAFLQDEIKGIILRVNSPGGAVAACDELFNKINSLKEEHKKPLVIYMEDIAASGGYLVSTTGDVIFANRSTLTGSIGVIMSSLNVHRLADDLGVEQKVYKSGNYKDLLNIFREVTPEESSILQEIVDETHDFFIDSVLEGRNMERDDLLDLADGRIYTATQALENGLIDEVGFLEDAINKTAELANTKDPNVLQFKRLPLRPYDFIFGQISRLTGGPSSVEDYIQNRKEEYPGLMYIWRP